MLYFNKAKLEPSPQKGRFFKVYSLSLVREIITKLVISSTSWFVEEDYYRTHTAEPMIHREKSPLSG